MPAPELAALLRLQQGLATRVQLREHGVSEDSLRWRIGRTWRLVLPGVVATFTGRLDGRQRPVAAQLYAGPGAVLSSWTAASWHGVESARAPQLRVAVPQSRSSRRCGFVVVTRTSRHDAHPWNRPPLVIASRPRAVIDAALDAGTERHAAEITIEALQRRLVTLEALRHELERAPRRGSRQGRVALAAAETSDWSLSEFDLLALVSGSRLLPEAWPNPTLTTLTGDPLPTPDLWLDDVGLAVALHSRRYHQRDADWDGTVMSDTALGELGVVVLPVTPAVLAREPAATLHRIERAHGALTGRPRPQVLATPRAALGLVS